MSTIRLSRFLLGTFLIQCALTGNLLAVPAQLLPDAEGDDPYVPSAGEVWASAELVYPNHWSYRAMVQLTEDGLQRRYGSGFFEDKPRTRIEIALALAEMLDMIDARESEFDGGTWVITRALREKYRPQLSFIVLQGFAYDLRYHDWPPQERKVATSSYDLVPIEHWSYAAFDYLATTEVLEGYPPGFFRGSIALRRYDMAQAVARVADYADVWQITQLEKTLVDALREEYSDQLTHSKF